MLSLTVNQAEAIIHILNSIHNLKISSLHIAFFLIISALTYYFLMLRRRRSVYLIDYALCKPPRLLRVPTARFIEHTHTGADDESYKCLSQEENSQGIQGVKLGKDLVAVAGEALKLNIAEIGPPFLPPSEKFLFALSLSNEKETLRKGGDRRAAEEPRPDKRAGGGAKDDAA
ncbi:hypothetical protein SASPL_125627 [Salvia splendens]|uniref:FAE domain-containing protein n=1 Tax=Salvia splendens TaxID=180675 RepID=A0A8X8ZQ12_SALSN|nr:hypothetical protein SASPL_125627 [Salvia splendens]